MLADQIGDFTDTLTGFQAVPYIHKVHQSYFAKVKTAPRFILDRTSNFLINDLKERTDPTKLVALLHMCRLPFPSMWVEFPFKDRTDWVAQSETYFSDHKVEADPPKRLGFLLEQATDNTITIHPAWDHQGFVNVCPMALSIDTADYGEYVPTDEEIRLVSDRQVQNSWTSRWKDKEDEIIACAELTSRIEYIVPESMVPMVNEIKKHPDMHRALLGASAYDLAGEWHFIMLLIVLLNSRNVVEFGQETDYAPLNKQRLKKGKAPLLSHRPIIISLSRVQKNRTQWEGSGSSRKPGRSAFVIGHLKVRKTGIFWWGPHYREGAGEAGPRTYRIVA